MPGHYDKIKKSESGKVPAYKPGFPFTRDKKSPHSLDVLQDAIRRDSTYLEGEGAFKKFFRKSFEDTETKIPSREKKLQINREYRDKMTFKVGGKVSDQDLGNMKAKFGMLGRTFKTD
tara:strand:+ start:653 stop:1006 length:354 start_codon:yes stop_codon:yes gene_type:complete